MKPAQRQRFFEILRELDPAPKTELVYASPFELLIAVILSAQATDVSVNKATKPLFAVANTPQSILALGEETLAHYVRTIGLYRTKTKNILATCALLIQKHHAQVPADRDALEALPGVGRKTANVVLNSVFGMPTIAVDTHIFRVSNRTGLAPGRNPLEVESKLLKVVPDEFKLHAHHWLILLGRYTCKARSPSCALCPVVGVCGFKEKTNTPSSTQAHPAQSPRATKRTPPPHARRSAPAKKANQAKKTTKKRR
jgi:endonuclease III